MTEIKEHICPFGVWVSMDHELVFEVDPEHDNFDWLVEKFDYCPICGKKIKRGGI